MQKLKKMQKTLLFLLFLISHLIFGQEFDKKLWDKIIQAEKIIHSQDFKKAEQFFNAEILANKGKIAHLAYLHAYKSRFYTLNDSLVLAKNEAQKSLSHSENSQNPTAKTASLMAQMYIDAVLGQSESVIKNGIEALKISELSEDFFTKYLVNYKLYATYSDWNEAKKMKFYSEEALKFASKSKDYNATANAHNALSSSYLSEYETTKNQALIQKSWEHLQHSFDLYRSHPTAIAQTTLSVTCNNIANHFLSYSKSTISEAKKQAFSYLDIVENIPNADALVLANINGIKSVFALKENNPDLAKFYLEKARQVIENEPRKNLETKIRIYNGLLAIVTGKNDFQSAFHYSQKINQLQSELFDENQRYNAQKLEIQYEMKKKNEELSLLATQVELQKKQKYLYIGLAVASLLGLFFMFRSYHFKLRYSIEREQNTLLEKQEMENQMLLKEKEKQLLEIQQVQLQKEAMATALQVHQKNEILQELRQKISQGDMQHLERIFRDDNFSDAHFEEVKEQIQKIRPHFFEQLQIQATQKLSLLDLKYCAYIHLKMNTKQISQLLNVEASSVRMFKYRLKQKFALPKEVDLEKFLQNVE